MYINSLISKLGKMQDRHANSRINFRDMRNKILSAILLMISYCISNAQVDSTINSLLNQYIVSSANNDAGMIVGVIDSNTEKANIFYKGAINRDNDLKLVCPASKPAISYLILKNGINIQSSIDKWFPTYKEYLKANEITIKMLLSNTSGIRDYVDVLTDKGLQCDAQYTVDLAYKSKTLAFNPGDSILYSNTGFNAAGIILEKETNKTVDDLLNQYFKEISPSIRMDDGKGYYPKGYKNPWPYHYSQSGFSGGLIGKIEDYLKMMDFIFKQPEFQIMTDWVTEVNGINWGLGIFGQGDIIMYQGNSGANLSFLIRINSKIIYVHTTNELDYNKFQGYVNNLIPLLMQI